MKMRLFTSFVLVLFLLLTAGSAWAQSGGSSNTGGFVFVLRGIDSGNSIYRYRADAGSGSLTYLGSTNTGQKGGQWENAHMLVYDPVNYRLYALHDLSNTITAYSVDRVSGSLTPLPFSPIHLGDGIWIAISLHPGGSPLIATDSSSRNLSSYKIETSAATVTATLAGKYSTGSTYGYALAFSRDGQFLYAGGTSGTLVAAFSANSTSGVLTALPGSPFDMGMGYPLAFATDSSGRLFLSALVAGSSKIATTSAGVPTVVSTLTSNGLSNAVDGLVHPGENFYLVADRSGNQVGVYRISGTGESSTLAAVAGSPFAMGGNFTQALVTNPGGSVVYALNSLGYTVTRFDFNADTGSLSGATTTTIPGTFGMLQGIAYVGNTWSPLFLPVVRR